MSRAPLEVDPEWLHRSRKIALQARPDQYKLNTRIFKDGYLLDGGFMIAKTVSGSFYTLPFQTKTRFDELGIELTDLVLQVNWKHSFMRAVLAGVLMKSTHQLMTQRQLPAAIAVLHQAALELRGEYQIDNQKLNHQSGAFKLLHSNILGMLMYLRERHLTLREIAYEASKDALSDARTPEQPINWAWIDLGYYILYKAAVARNQEFYPPHLGDVHDKLRRLHPQAASDLTIDDLLFFKHAWSEDMQNILCRALGISILHIVQEGAGIQVRRLGLCGIEPSFSLLTVHGRTGLILHQEIYNMIKNMPKRVRFEDEVFKAEVPSPCKCEIAETIQQATQDLQEQLTSLIRLKTQKLSQPEQNAGSAFAISFQQFKANVLSITFKYYSQRREIFQALRHSFEVQMGLMLPQTVKNYQSIEHYLLRLLFPFKSDTQAFDTLLLKYARQDASLRDKRKLNFLLAWEQKIITQPDSTINFCFELVKSECPNNHEMKALLEPRSGFLFYHRHTFIDFIQSVLKKNTFVLPENMSSSEAQNRGLLPLKTH